MADEFEGGSLPTAEAVRSLLEERGYAAHERVADVYAIALQQIEKLSELFEGGEWRQDYGWRFVDGVGSFHGYAKPFDVTPQRQGHTPREATVRDIWYGPPRPYVEAEVATDG